MLFDRGFALARTCHHFQEAQGRLERTVGVLTTLRALPIACSVVTPLDGPRSREHQTVSAADWARSLVERAGGADAYWLQRAVLVTLREAYDGVQVA